ncbi:hypothetical protein K435DRAFT_810464 [Dendrothele bispora CBS 962.96]|uniref:Uncharacterized protein n=1 Tax=Dendrothele bispora (strain CBS 962.96) TaxID=1314807 RepID=A0A4S8KV25_DENBC|nr:hypothetical protein K435DRAFT_810464 [Dendrothele bispora CBS 962.96]
MNKSYSFVSSPWRSIHGTEGIVLAHGWTRFQYDVTNWGKNFSYSVNLPRRLEKRLESAWLCQGMSWVNVIGGDISNLEQYDVGTVIHPNIIPKNIFIFIAPMSLNQCLESGSTEISQRVCDLIGLPKYKVEIYPFSFYGHNYQFQAIQDLQKFLRYDSSTQDFAESCGLPLIEVTSLFEDPDQAHNQPMEELDNWHVVRDNLALDEVLGSNSESIHDDTDAKLQEIWFPIPRIQREMKLTVLEILNYQDLDVSELDSCSEDWSDLGSETSKFDSASHVPIQYLEPSPWLEGYLIGNDDLNKSCRGPTSDMCQVWYKVWDSTLLTLEHHGVESRGKDENPNCERIKLFIIQSRVTRSKVLIPVA